MSNQVTRKNIMQLYNNVICVSYCDLQSLFSTSDRIGYTAGAYGWNADVYMLDSETVIVTGYRPFGNIRQDRNYNRGIELRAREILNTTADRNTAADQLDALKAELLTHYTQVA